MKNNLNTIKKNLLLFLLVGIIIIVIGFSSNLISKVHAIENGSKDSFITDQSALDKDQITYETENKYVSISNFYNESTKVISGAPSADQVITISTSRELYLFSYLCFNEERFLGYDYELLANIEYGLEEYFIPIGYMATSDAATPTAFTGSFNGNGFEIYNLRYIILNDEMFNSGIYATKKLTTFSMFAYNNGTIENFGLIEPELLQNYTIDTIQYISPLVGNNTGTISNIYLKDLRDPANDGGIYANDYSVSGFVSTNTGTIDNCYVAYSSVLNYAVFNYISFVPLVYNGTVTNCYFYDESIESFTDGVYTYNQYFGYRTTMNLLGTYANSADVIRNGLLNSDGWFSKDSYSLSIFNDEYPIRKGLITHSLDEIDNNNGVDAAFTINNEFDLAYVYQLANDNSYFFSKKVSYYITNNLDFKKLPKGLFAYDDYIDSRFVGVASSSFSVRLLNGDVSNYPTIYNPYIDNYIEYAGSVYYGMFPLFDGIIENLNIVSKNVSDNFISHNNTEAYKTIGIVCGLIDGGTIKNVNILGNISLSNNAFGNYYCGILAGVAGRGATIDNVTTCGSITGGTHDGTTYDAKVGYVTGNSMGGVVGYTLNNIGNITNVLSDVALTATNFTSSNSINQYLGGIIGSGYIAKIYHVTNHGNITITNTYSNIIAAGIIGNLFGARNIVEGVHNQGDITVTINSLNKVLISGVMNVDFVMTETNTLAKSSLDTFYGAGISNASNINVTNNVTLSSENAASLSNISITGVLFVNANNGFKSEISGLYNLGYKYNGNTKEHFDTNVTIDISLLDSYAPCIKSSATSENGAMIIDTVYNFRNVDYVANQNIYFDNVKYSGCILGKYMTLSSIYNEGNLDFNISKDAPNVLSLGNNLYKKFIVVGVFEEVSQGHSANIIYNDGDINFYLTQDVNDFYFNLFLSGICYANRSSALNDSDYDIYRLESNKYDKNAVGSLNQTINNGKIEAKSHAIENSIYGKFEEKSANGQVVTGVKWYSAPYGSSTISFDKNGNITSSINTNGLLKGMSNISGVCAINEYVITNTFNLGNIFNANYIVEASGDYNYPGGFEVNSGGLTYANIGKYAQIKDSANNGVIKAINFSSISNSSANAAGISVRNDVLETGADYTSGGNHSKQTICFTINYGEVYSYNYCNNVGSIEQEQHAKSAGIMALGLCSIVNTVNYANIYGSEVSSGIFGLVYFEKVATEVNNANKIIFANSINYGNIWGINKGANSYLTQNQGNTKKDNQTYDELYAMKFSNQDDYASIDLIGEAKDARLGALIGVSNLNNSANAQYISIRYLINFCNSIPLVGGEYGIASEVNPTVDTMVSTYSKIENGHTTYDKFMGKTVTYGPLSSEIVVINGVQYPGVFNRNFQFRLAVEGEIPPVEETDNYINDFFSFVGFTKINDSLLEKIGWRTIAYTAASIEFTKDLEAMENLMRMYKEASSTGYNQLVDNALNTSSWIGNADPLVLPNLVQSILDGKDYSTLQDLIKYLFMTADNKNAITKEMRKSVIEELLAHLNTTATPKEYLEAILFGDGSSYSEILAEVISTNDLEKEVIKQFIFDQLNELSNRELEKIARDYISLLNSNQFDTYINDSSMIEARINVLKVLTNNVDDAILLNITQHLELVSTEYEVIVKMRLAYDQFTTEERRELFLNILTYNTDIDNFNSVINAVSEKINYYDKVNEINKTNLNNENDLTNANNYLEIWNLIRNSKYFTDYLDTILPTITDINGTSEKGIYGIATEARNTFQSLDKPAYDGRNVKNFNNGNNESLIFNYEPTISPNTYFYGPFRNINSSHTVGYKFDDSTYGASLPGGFKYTPSFTDIGNQSGSNAYVPTFTTTDKEIIKKLVDTSPIAFYYDKNEQFVSESYFNAFPSASSSLLQDFSGTNLIPGKDITVSSTDKGTVTGKTVDGDTISGFTGDKSLGTWTLTIGKVSYSMSGTSTQYANFIKNYAIKYYMSAKAQVGIIRFYNPYSTFRASYFTAKSGESGGVKGYVYTTQYIDYKSTDLAELDGILTGYTETKVQSQDEIDLINVVCTNYLFSSTNKAKTVKIIKKILLETLQNDSLTIDKFFSELINNNENIINSKPMKDYLVVDSVNTTLSTYLVDNCIDNSQNKLLLLGSTHLGNFKYTIDYLLNESNGYYAYLHGKYPNFDEILQSFEPKYILDLIDYAINVGGMSFDEALAAVNQLTTSDIESLLNNYPTFSADLSTIISSVGSNFPANYTFSNTWISTYNPQVIDGVSYTFGVLANNANTNNNTITFTASKSGNVLITSSNGSRITINGNSGKAINTNIYSWDVVASTSYTIRCSQGVVIYNINETNVIESLDTTSSGTNITYDKTFSYQTGSQSITYYTSEGKNPSSGKASYNGYLLVPAGGVITFTVPSSGTYSIAFTAASSSSTTITMSNGVNENKYWYYIYLDGKSGSLDDSSKISDARLYFYDNTLTAGSTYTLKFSRETYLYAIGLHTYSSSSYSWTYTAISSSNYAKKFDSIFKSDIVSISPFKTNAFISHNNKLYGEDLPIIRLNNLIAGNAVNVTAQGSGGTISLVSGSTTVSTVNLTSSMNKYTFTIPSDGDYTLKITGFVTYEDVVIIEHTYNNFSCPIEYYFSNEFEEFLNQDNSSSIKGKELLEDYIIDSIINSNDIIIEHLSINNLSENGTITSNIVSGVFTINANTTSNVIISNTTPKYLNLVSYGSTTNRNVQFNVSSDSYVIVKASGMSLVLGIGANSYVKPISSTDNYHIYDVAAGSQCYLYSNDSNCYIYDIYIVDKSINSTILKNKFNELYPNFPTTTGTITGLNGIDGNLYERYSVFKDTNRSNADFINDFKNLILFFSPKTFDYNTNGSLWNLFTDSELQQLSIMLGIAFDEVLETYIYDDDTLLSLQKVIEILITGDGRLTDDIFKYLNLDSSTLTDAQKDALTAIYVSTDFNVVMDNAENNAAITAKDSELFNIITSLPTEYCYYDTDGNLINNKFEALMQELGYNLVTTGYGIYALASSHGIYNGAYIPDNITFNTVIFENDTEINTLTEMNPYYQLSANNKYELTDQRSADWRSELTDGDELTTDSSSVNYGFKVAMKQLKKSIATTIFDLVLVDNAGNNYNLYTDSEYIVLEVDDDDTLGSVTFYVPGNIGSAILSSTFVISSYEISDKATLNVEGKEFTVESATPTTIRVVAEDTTVYKDYDVYIKKTGNVSIAYDSYEVVTNDGTKNGTITDSTISDPISYKDGNMLVNLTTKYVPKMTDLTKYLYLDGMLLTDTGLIELNNVPYVGENSSSNWLNGDILTATLDMKIADELASGTHTLTIKYSEECKFDLTFTKSASPEKEIIKMIFDGEEVVFDVNNEAITYIKMGRTFTEADLVSIGSIPLYLDNIVISPLATISTTATIVLDNVEEKTVNGVTIYTNGIVTYKVIYTITPEDGSSTSQYTHYLVEMDPFMDAKDNNGDFITGSSYNRNNYAHIYENGKTTTYVPTTDGQFNIEFRRGSNPKYQASFNLDKFYTESMMIEDYLSVNGLYNFNSFDSNNIYQINIKPSGFNVDFFDAADIGVYSFILQYATDPNGISWNSTTKFQRVYNLPSLNIEKLESVDSYLKNIAFTREANKLSNLATVISLQKIIESSDDPNATNTYEYISALPETSRDVVSNATYGIIYQTEAALNAKEYYIVGSVSDAMLESYSPLFTTESHAKIYRYVMNGNQRLLYVEFVDDSDNKQIFLVDEAFNNVYLESDLNTSIGSLSDNKFTYNNTLYTISNMSGTVSDSNLSLYADFVGNPEEGELWYNDYIVYAENYVNDDSQYHLYHIAVIDITNSIYFTFVINDESTNKVLGNEYIYFRINGKAVAAATNQPGESLGEIGVFAENTLETTETGASIYATKNSIQALQYGYYYFTIDLPDGLKATYTVQSNKANQSGIEDQSYLPPASLVTQRIKITITITDSNESSRPWGENLSSLYEKLVDRG